MYYKHRKHIKIKVLLTPGTTIPIDIKKPDKTKNPLENSFNPFAKTKFFSKTTKIYPKINVAKLNSKYLTLNLFSEFTFFISIGMLPKINPIKQKLVWIGNVLNNPFKILPTQKTPMIPPRAIGKMYKKFFLKFLNNPKSELINLSYIPSITQITPLLIPGSMAPAPNNIPIKKSWIFFKRITNRLYEKKKKFMNLKVLKRIN